MSYGHGFPGNVFINNNLPISSRVLTFNINPYYINKEVIDSIAYQPSYGRSMAEVLLSSTNEGFMKKLRQLKITHVAVNLLGPVNYKNRMDQLSKGGYLSLIYSEKGMKIYSVEKRAGNAVSTDSPAEKVVREYQNQLKADPKNMEALVKLAAIESIRLDYWNRDYDEAIRLSEKVLDLDPKNLPAYLNLGYTYWIREAYYDWGEPYKDKMAGYRRSMDYFMKALKLDPMNTVALSGIMYNHSMTGNFGNIMSAEMKRIRKFKGDSALLSPTLTAACTFLFLDKLNVILGYILSIGLIAFLILRQYLKEDRVLLSLASIWLYIIFANYFPILFIPFVKIYLSYL
jgi:tetratricopeptide (TPR) repeat protein